MKSPIIAILYDDELRRSAMQRQLDLIAPNAKVHFFDNAPEMVEWFKTMLYSVNLISLDHDLGPNKIHYEQVFDPGTGRDVVDFLCEHQPVCPILIHSSNVPAAQGMHFALEENDWQNERIFPSDDLEWISEQWSRAVLNKIS